LLIRRVEVQGFKSFLGKEVLEMGSGINVIVGPNGSGKSNLIDAFNWVLGEQSARVLRGERMEDVIFAGSRSKKPVGMAQVSLLIDNSDGKLPLEYHELMITRRLYRSGESQFFINRVPCRLRDIRELFWGTGSGRSALTVINQGQVDQILNTKPSQRREVFEEASGISKFLVRYRETESQLLIIDQNLRRLTDYIREMDKNFAFLKKEAEKAEEYLEVKEKRDFLQAAILTREAKKIFNKIAEWYQEKRSVELFLEKYSMQRSQFEKMLERQKRETERISNLRKKLSRKENELYLKREKLNNQGNVFKERKNWLAERVAGLITSIKEAKAGLEDLALEIKDKKKNLEKTALDFDLLKERLETFQSRDKELDGEISRLEERIKRLRAGIVEVLGRRSDIQNEINSIEKELATVKREKENSEFRLKQLEKNYNNLQKMAAGHEKSIEKLKQQKDSLAQEELSINRELNCLQDKIKKVGNTLQNYKEKLQQIASEKKLLARMQKNYEGYSREIQELFCKGGDKLLSGICGVVGNLIEVPPAYRNAIEICLGAKLNNVVTETAEDAKKAIGFLKQRNAGRLTFLPLDTLTGRKILRTEIGNISDRVFVAADIVRTEEKFRVVVDYLLGRILVVENLNVALKIARQAGFRYMIVTKHGDIIHPGGALTGGSFGKAGAKLIGRKEMIKDLQQKKSEVEAKIFELSRTKERMEKQYLEEKQKYDETLGKLKNISMRLQEEKAGFEFIKNQINGVDKEKFLIREEIKQYSGLVRDLENRLKSLLDKLKRKEAVVEKLNSSLEKYEKSLTNLKEDREKNATHLNSLKIKMAELEQKKIHLEKEIEHLHVFKRQKHKALSQEKNELQRLNAEIISLENDILRVENELKRLNSSANHLRKKAEKISKTQSSLREIEERYRIVIEKIDARMEAFKKRTRQCENELLRFRLKAKQLQEKIDGVDPIYLDRFRKGITGVNKSSYKLLANLEERLKSLEPVNISAIEEYKNYLAEREHLLSHLEDLKRARLHLKELGSLIKHQMNKRFLEFFARVQARFNEVYSNLFEGGSAQLTMSNNAKPLEADIEITVSPPGKKAQSLMLLSGGERALTALALLFAILKEKESPFCILDEVDTSLDETNVQRFTRFLRDCSSTTQFIVVSHRQKTMEIADTLYGITMPEDGVSKIVSVKLRNVG